jgi:probable HAF family extracellular repeat protein
MLSIVAFLVIAPMAAGSSANAVTFSFTQIDVPGAFFTEAFGINDAGQIVGDFGIIAGGTHGFLDTGGSFTQIDVPGAGVTEAHGINDAGQIVGRFSGPGEQGFLTNNAGGSFTQIDVPGAFFTVAYGINDAGQIVGTFEDSTAVIHGFLTNNAGGSFTQIDPGGTDARGINDAGQIVGIAGDHGFLLDTGGSFIQIDVPDASFTQAFGINDAGQIVGRFSDSTGVHDVHGFLATPVPAVPEPSTLVLLSVGIGLTVLCVMRRREEPIIPKQRVGRVCRKLWHGPHDGREPAFF